MAKLKLKVKQEDRKKKKNNGQMYFSKVSKHFKSKEDYIKVYKSVAEVLNNMKDGSVGFKAAFSKTRLHPKIAYHVYAIGSKVFNNLIICQDILEDSGILKEHQNIDKYLIMAVIADFLWGCQQIVGAGQVFDIVREKQDILKELKGKHMEFKENDNYNVFVRVNTVKYSIEEFLQHLKDCQYKIMDTPPTYKAYVEAIKSLKPSRFMVDYHFKDLLVFHAKAKPFLLDDSVLQSKCATIQDKSSLIAVNLLNVEPGSTVLDMCAAPGMKTVYMAAQLKNEGKILAVDRDKPRYLSLLGLVKSFGVDNIVKCINLDVTKFKCMSNEIDFILLDAPCSGSGMRDRLGDTDCSIKRLRALHWLQVKLLTQALKYYPNVKRILYSTCSTTIEENESVIKDALINCGNNVSFKLIDCHKILDGFSTGKDGFECSSFCLRTDTERDCTNGFFIALFERFKQDDDVLTEEPEKNKKETCNKRKHSLNKNSDKPDSKGVKKLKSGWVVEEVTEPIIKTETDSNVTKVKKQKRKNTKSQTIADNSSKKPIDNSSKKPTDNSSKKPTDNSSKKPINNSSKKPADNSSKKPIDNAPKKPIDNSSKKPNDNSSKKLKKKKSRKSNSNLSKEEIIKVDQEIIANSESIVKKSKKKKKKKLVN